MAKHLVLENKSLFKYSPKDSSDLWMSSSSEPAQIQNTQTHLKANLLLAIYSKRPTQ